ncbi:MAG: exosortase/archaeosortase family protein [Planctomycetes bacterium]|nr:exosortase/archaeosortase family protein [Planctomycetota bacterium]
MLFRVEITELVSGWQNPKEMHGFLIPLFSLYFLYLERGRLKRTLGKPSYLGLVLMLLSIFGYLFFFFIRFEYPQDLMMLVMLGGLVLFLGGWPIVKLVWLPVAFLFFAIPISFTINEAISFPLRKIASIISALILNVMPNINADSVGYTIKGTYNNVPFTNLDVAEACSGMRLLQAFVALGVAMAYLEYRPLVHRIILLISTIPIAIFCNVIRVLLTGVIHIYVGEKYATGTLHTLLGMMMLLLAFSLYGLLAWVMEAMYIDDEDDDQDILVVQRAEAKT